jgi:hypothetical protein
MEIQKRRLVTAADRRQSRMVCSAGPAKKGRAATANRLRRRAPPGGAANQAQAEQPRHCHPERGSEGCFSETDAGKAVDTGNHGCSLNWVAVLRNQRR